MSIPKTILEEVSALSPTNKAEPVDCLLASLGAPDKEIDQLWRQEVEGLIDACKRGEIRALKIEEAIRKYR